MRSLVVAIILSFVASVALAQSPYAGMQTRPIKALSDQQITDLKAGRGMGLALHAELNGYPGPAHVLECATVAASHRPGPSKNWTPALSSKTAGNFDVGGNGPFSGLGLGERGGSPPLIIPVIRQ